MRLTAASLRLLSREQTFVQISKSDTDANLLAIADNLRGNRIGAKASPHDEF